MLNDNLLEHIYIPPGLALGWEQLNLRHNNLTTIIDVTDGDYATITSRSGHSWDGAVATLKISGFSADVLPRLARLDIAENALNVIARRWSPFTARGGIVWRQMKELLLDGCDVEYVEPGALDGLVNLSILSLADNRLDVSVRQ